MMEKERTTRRSLLRALYLLPLVCISLALNAQTKVNYVYNDNEADQSPKVTVIKATLNQDTLEFTGTADYNLIKSLPGVQFDEDGNITVNGKPVSKVLMDGKVVYDNQDSNTPDHTIHMNYSNNKEYVSYTDTIYSTVSDGSKRMSITSGMFKTDANDPRLNDVAKTNISLSLSYDANIEEEIRNLPGVEIDDDGYISVNGKPVRRILVNGKEYYSGDPDNIYASRIVEEVEGEIPDGHNRVTTVTVNENGQVSITSEDKPEQAKPANISAKIIDEDDNITIDSKNGIRVNLNGTQVAK